MSVGAAPRTRLPVSIRIALWGAAGLLAVFFVAPLVCSSPEERLEEALRSLTARGIVTTLAEWNAAGVVPGENGAAEIDAADDWLSGTFGPESEWPSPLAVRDSEEETRPDAAADTSSAAVDDFLVRARPWFDRLEAASQRPTIRWPAGDPWALAGPSSPARRLQRSQRLLHALALRGVSMDDRLRSVAIRLRITGRFDSRDEITHLVATAITASAAQDLRAIAGDGDPGLVAARPALDRLLDQNVSATLPHVARCVVVSQSELLRGMFAGRFRDANGAARMPASRTSLWGLYAFWWGGESWSAVESLGQAADVGVMEPAAAVRAYRSIDAGAPRLARHATLVPPIVALRACRTDAALRVTRVGLAALVHREATGAWPRTAEDLRSAFGGGFPIDPFTGEPIRMTVSDGGVRIESAGRLPEDPPEAESDLRERGCVWDLPAR